MKLDLAFPPLDALNTPALALLLTEGARLEGLAADADRLSNGRISTIIAGGDFKGKARELLLIYAPDAPYERVLLVGLGDAKKQSLESLRDASGTAALYARKLGLPRLAVALPDAGADTARAVSEGILLSQYQLHTYRTTELDEVKTLRDATVLAPAGADPVALEAALETSRDASVIETARTWILHPGGVFTPPRFAEEAKHEADALGLKTTIFDLAELERRGFGTLIAVGQGSVHEPRLIQVEYLGGKPGDAPMAIVGKGITFDTGGLGIKPGPGMEKMKYDMAGGAAALAIVFACARLKLPFNVTAIVAAAENMPSATAIKPGDVVKSFTGLTIEINDTDAEGRLVLADALGYAATMKPQLIVDMATLTGSVGAALGRKTTGVMGNRQDLVNRFLAVAEHAGERGWQLPLLEEYHETLESHIADMRNYGGRWGDTVNAATMLSYFVDDIPWLHLDIAGAGWADDEARGYRIKGPTGTPVRAVVDLIAGWGR